MDYRNAAFHPPNEDDDIYDTVDSGGADNTYGDVAEDTIYEECARRDNRNNYPPNANKYTVSGPTNTNAGNANVMYTDYNPDDDNNMYEVADAHNVGGNQGNVKKDNVSDLLIYTNRDRTIRKIP